MGLTTPNISIYVPAAGETNYDASFLNGMINVDQHDHSGGPTKGVPIATAGIADGSITYSKLNPNVVDTTSGLGTHGGGLANQITTTGLLNSIANLASGDGFMVQIGLTAGKVTLTGTANQIAITNPTGSSAGSPANPVFSLATPVLLPTNPGFQAYKSVDQTNATGNGTLVTVGYDSHTFDRAANFSSPTFTAPANGLYFFTASLVLKNLGAGHTSGQCYLQQAGSINMIQYGFRGNPFACSDGGNLAIEANAAFFMQAGDTVQFLTVVSGSTQTVSIGGGALSTGPTSLEGFLVN